MRVTLLLNLLALESNGALNLRCGRDGAGHCELQLPSKACTPTYVRIMLRA